MCFLLTDGPRVRETGIRAQRFQCSMYHVVSYVGAELGVWRREFRGWGSGVGGGGGGGGVTSPYFFPNSHLYKM